MITMQVYIIRHPHRIDTTVNYSLETECCMVYIPDTAVLPILASILDLVADSREIQHSFKRRPRLLSRLPGGELYCDSSLELDTDGLPAGAGRGDPTWQGATSLRYADGSSINPDRVPYFVLPLPRAWPSQFGIELGDYAAVIRGRRLAYAVFGDFGPNPGEGSIELLRRLGAERLRTDGSIINAGVGSGVVTIVFPGSGLGRRPADENELLTDLMLKAPRLFSELGGSAELVGPASARKVLPRSAPGLPITPNPGLAARVAQFADAEFGEYGHYVEDQSPLRERIGLYWKQLKRDHDGADHGVFWSAAFVSYMVHLAGGDDAFECSGMHSKYVNRAILDRIAGRTSRYWGYRTSELKPAVGDILAMNRGSGRTLDYEEARKSDHYPSHADIVTSVDAGGVHTVGGNVGKAPGTVGRKRFRWSEGTLRNANDARQQVHAILRPPAL